MVGVRCVSIPRDRVVVVGHIDVVISKLVVLELSGSVDFTVIVSSNFGAMIRMVLLIFLFPVLR